ncbi:acetyl-CoA carboxylase biotin carboxylase subunit [Halalkalibacillus halophilus]|uniref:acetyl-CoA carboxylase biotin carboxylase subunit n=1 Tax=Halalkalibacillus halophilus TaxID=392827 RepID=UPI00042A6CED|nr:acetyl-CoA carboxylase biotin carboxylase subunit [Halalkalibacillus halophilus]
MFQKILIANRGEIASRIIRTCKKLNIQTVAVYSEADQEAPFVSEADEAVLIGPAKVNESYLNAEKIIDVAKEHGVDAVHPGYGLLSENGDFAKKCNQEKLTFIGPKPEIIDQMGSKLTARNLMKKAGVPVIPGTDDPVSDTDEAKKFANEIGYPVMLKATHGGGGIGMEIVENDEQLEKAFDGNARRAEQFFGNGTMYVEKVINGAHHIEFQVLADHHGNTIHLFERECSIQRRHQKVLEEAPSVLLDAEVRQDMGKAAVTATEAIHYTNAGTIEFLVDKSSNFYFLEMNTRLQVEHPVTEEITGYDLVEQQLRIAYGEELNIKQHVASIDGHAMEVRIYAEDPKTFFPSPGKITTFEPPTENHIRNEVGVASGYQVTPYYDPMIAKMIVTGTTRDEVIEKLRDALVDYKVEGIKTNIPFLIDITNEVEFVRGNTKTSFINDYMKK